MDNLPADYLYRKIPVGILSEDTRGLLRAVVLACQDRVAELRSLAQQLNEIWNPANSIGSSVSVVRAVYLTPEGAQDTTLLDLPPGPQPTDLGAWVVAQAGIDESELVSYEVTTDANRAAEASTLHLLAETLGARLYPTLRPGAEAQVENYRRCLRVYFDRLKTKGTSLGFDLLGKLHGFGDVRVTPLWSRMSIRDPRNAGAASNDPDFSQFPQGVPVPGTKSYLYDRELLNDGDAFTWESTALTVDQDQTTYALTVVNSGNPYAKVLAVSATIAIPAAGIYTFSGGSEGARAKTEVLPTADGGSSGLQLEALVDGSSFNGMQVEVTHAAGEAFTFKIRYNLSSIKFRSSFFDLAATADWLTYASDYSGFVTESSTLLGNPDVAVGQTIPHANSYVAVAPWRPWTGGAQVPPVVTLWPTTSVFVGSGTPTERVQATVDTVAVDQAPLDAATQIFESAVDDVRVATRRVRKSSYGLGLSTQVEYAAYPGYKQLAIVSSGTASISGSAGTEGVDYPFRPYSASFFVEYGGQSYPIIAESSTADPDLVILKFAMEEPFALEFTGSYTVASGNYAFTASVPLGDEWTLSARWTALSSEVIQTAPEDYTTAKYAERPQDDVEAISDDQFTDVYPWQRLPVAMGHDIESGSEKPEGYETFEVTPSKLVLANERGESYEVVGVSYFGTDRGYAIPQETELVSGYPAVGLDSDGAKYRLGLVRGNLVANPNLFWSEAIKTALTGWMPFNEHPSQPYRFIDCSDLALTNAELETGAFQGTYSLSDRVWDDDRGWTQGFANATGLTLVKDRSPSGKVTISMWLKTATDAELGSGVTIFQYGPLRLKAFGTGELLTVVKTYLVNGDTEQLVGSQLITEGSFVPYWFAVEPIDASALETVDIVYAENVADLEDVPSGYYAGQQAILIAQDDPTENGVYLIGDGAWYRVASETGQDERGAMYSTPSGIYRCSNAAEITYGVTAIEYAKVSAKWYGRAASTSVSINSSGLIATVTSSSAIGVQVGDRVSISGCAEEAYNGLVVVESVAGATFTYKTKSTPPGSNATGSPIVITNLPQYVVCDALTEDTTVLTVSGWSAGMLYLSDLRFWDAVKSVEEVEQALRPKLTKLDSGWVSLFESTDGLRSLQVTSSGYAYPATSSVDLRIQTIQRVARYNSYAEHVGPEGNRLVGYGDGLVANEIVLGSDGTFARAAGNYVAASSDGQLLGFNNLWFDSNIVGEYTRAPYPPGSDVTVEASFSVWPPHIADQNPCQDHIFLPGTDGQIYTVFVDVEKVGDSYVAALQAKVPVTSTKRPLSDPTFYHTNLLPESAEVQTNAVTVLESEAYGRLTVAVGPEIAIAFLGSGQTTTAPVYLYSHAQRVLEQDYPVGWSELDQADKTVDIEVPARATAGPLSIRGTEASLPAGTYRLAIDSYNLEEPDSSWTGHTVEASLTSYSAAGVELTSSNVVTAKISGTAAAKFRITDGTDATDLLLSGATAAQVQTALDRAFGETIEVLTADPYSSVRAGPYYLRWLENGAREKLTLLVDGDLEYLVTNVVEGDGSTRAIQRLELIRPVSYIELRTTDEMSVADSAYWKINLYYTNPKAGYRTLTLRKIALYQVSTQLYKLAPLASVTLERVTPTTPVSHAGGFRGKIGLDGVATYLHESLVYGVNSVVGSLVGRSSLPAAELLTGSSTRRLHFVTTPIITLSDEVDPAWPPISARINIPTVCIAPTITDTGCTPVSITDTACTPPTYITTTALFFPIGVPTTYDLVATGDPIVSFLAAPSWTLPTGVTMAGSVISGTATTDSVIDITTSMANGCGTASALFNFSSARTEITEVEWGVTWYYRFTMDSTYMEIQPDSTWPVTTYYQSGEGLSYPLLYQFAGKTVYGTTDDGTPLGPITMHVHGYNDAPAADGTRVVSSPLESVSWTATNKFRIYYGDYDGAWPPADEYYYPFTAADITNLTHNDGEAGPLSMLCTTARDVQLDFGATSTPKYRIIAVPWMVGIFGEYMTTPVHFTRLRYANDSEADIVGSPAWDGLDYGLLPYMGNTAYFVGLPINNVQYSVYVVNATDAAFSIYLRYVP